MAAIFDWQKARRFVILAAGFINPTIWRCNGNQE
jgi:hypothetical protein